MKRKDFKATDFSYICSKHFTAESFEPCKFGGTWLKKDAVPTIFQFTNNPDKFKRKRKFEIHENVDIQEGKNPKSITRYKRNLILLFRTKFLS